jgi:hypothetical protein
LLNILLSLAVAAVVAVLGIIWMAVAALVVIELPQIFLFHMALQ